ncbi:synaptotagmin-like protein 2 isoform X2 [Periophthalmus magnuspinnatus]|uniref:synaptotagmin-like protein 2 isoform X2 n=1 Tax=Periophthalmus magnuspinnatus TaxID=409849 RepID=UPI002436D09C|nr:synaptotagmin-like protein 2 isoform X2 [Periophthalmus magnuspinnatus]
MIDLSFLTDEEQETILTVLKRDAELKKAEEQRVQRLQQMVSNKGQLKYLTGEWFYEAKQLRHQERIHGSEIIWASIKHTHKPITILELSQIAPQRPSFVSSDNKDVFVPAVLSGLLQEPLTTPDNNWDHVQNSYEQGPSKHLSPTKQRLNPFNSTADEPGCADESQTTQQSPYSQPDGHGEKSGPVMSALRRLSSKISSSKSLEDLTSPTREEKEHMNRSVDDVSEIPSTASFATSKKSSVSVPAFQLDETDSDSPFENNMSWRRNTGSSASNISLSSGMASMSSVSGSMTSINHMDLGDVDVQGTIQFAVNYIQKLGEFHIFVVHCRDLAVGDAKKSRSDPYVKCYLLPDKTKLGKRKTTIKKKTLNPTYNEILRFKILLEVLKSQHLNVSVWHNDTFGRNSFLGEVDLDLSEWDFSNAQINEYALKARTASLALTSNPSPTRTSDIRGQMRVALRFLPQASPSRGPSRNETGEVQIWVKDCKNLPPIRGVIIDPFVKCTVLPDTSRKSRQKTRVVKRTANPMFNHTMVYDGFRPEDLREACVELTVWDHDRLNNHYIGGVRLGRGSGKSYGVDVNWMDSTTSEANLWQRMLESVGEWVEDVLPLRMLLMAKSMAK